MRTLAWLLICCLLLGGVAVAEETDWVAEAKTVFEAFLAGDVDAYYDRLSPQIQAALTPEALVETASQLTGAFGAFEAYGAQQMVGLAVAIELRMQSGVLVGQIVFDAEGTIAEFLFTPASQPQVRDTSLAANEETVTVGPYALEGVLTLPEGEGPFPGVVLVHGSGPHDRNEAIGDTAIFRDLAQGLAAQGVAVLRYDKRTYAMGQGKIPFTQEDLDNLTFYEETIEDAVEAAQLLQGDARVDPDRVFILGHSLGGMLANRIQLAGADTAGLVIMAGTLRHLADLLADQLEAQDAGIGAFAEMISLARSLGGMTEEAARAETLLDVSAYQFWEETQHDLTAAAQEAAMPMLILQGTEDQNVYADVDFVLWEEYARAHPDQDITLTLYEGLGHDFTEDGKVKQEVIDEIAGWILLR